MANNYNIVMGDSASQIPEKFYGNLKKNVRIENTIDGNVLEFDWVDEIEKAVPYIDNIFDISYVALSNGLVIFSASFISMSII